MCRPAIGAEESLTRGSSGGAARIHLTVRKSLLSIGGRCVIETQVKSPSTPHPHATRKRLCVSLTFMATDHIVALLLAKRDKLPFERR
jgi:hypothetical protein